MTTTHLIVPCREDEDDYLLVRRDAPNRILLRVTDDVADDGRGRCVVITAEDAMVLGRHLIALAELDMEDK